MSAVSSVVHEVHVDVGELGILQYLEVFVIKHLPLYFITILTFIAIPATVLRLRSTCVLRDITPTCTRCAVLSVRATYIVVVAEHGTARNKLTKAHLSSHTSSAD